MDEEDARQIAPGQAARIALTSDGAWEFAGVVRRVSSQARAADARGQGSGGSAEFEVQILLEPPAGARLLVGSTVTISVDPEPGPATLRIPMAAVAWSASGRPVVRVRRSASDQGRLQEIVAGKSLADSVEVKAGLAAGDEVWVPGAHPAPVAAAGPGILGQLLSGAGHD